MDDTVLDRQARNGFLNSQLVIGLGHHEFLLLDEPDL